MLLLPGEERGHATFAGTTGTTGYVMADAVKFQRLSTSTDRSVVLPQASEAYTYDADGNLTSDGLWQYFWDGENRLIRMESSLAVPETKRKRLIFAYDYMGRRIKKAVCGWSTSLGGYGPESLSYRYVYDGWNLIAELSRTDSLVRTCTWGPDLSGSQQGAGGIGGLIVVKDYTTGGKGVYYPAYDGNGNLTAMVKAEDGTAAAGYEYSPYGELLTSSGDYARENPFRFSTKYTDSETGLAYFGYRYYNPETGRWLNRDPIEERGGLNLYEYAINDPSNYIDVNGNTAIQANNISNVLTGTTTGQDGGIILPPGKLVEIFLKVKNSIPCGWFAPTGLSNCTGSVNCTDITPGGCGLYKLLVGKDICKAIAKSIKDLPSGMGYESKCPKGEGCVNKAHFDGSYPVQVHIENWEIDLFFGVTKFSLNGNVSGTLDIQGEMGTCKKCPRKKK